MEEAEVDLKVPIVTILIDYIKLLCFLPSEEAIHLSNWNGLHGDNSWYNKATYPYNIKNRSMR